MDKLKQILGDKLQENVPLSGYTTLKIGGPARFFTEISDQVLLVEVLKLCNLENIQYLLIGTGSNLLISDEGYPGLIIYYTLSGIEEPEDGSLRIKSGTSLNNLVDYTISNGLDGMSTMKGVPGTVGGAIYGSAGAYGDNIRDYLQEILCFDGQSSITITKDQYNTGYRDSIFKKNKNLIILEAKFGGFPKADPKELEAESQKILEVRSLKYPPDTKCPGSFFKNVEVTKVSKESLEKIPQDKVFFGKIPAGYLLESVGAKGDRIGQIQVASNHANTFVNLGGGTSKDFYALAKKWHQAVKDKFGIELEPEVQLINLEPL